jgi:hypothetical protein
MHPPRFTIGQLLLIVTAFSIGLAALKGNDLRGIGLSMLMIVGLLGAALGAGSDAGRPGPSSPGPSSAVRLSDAGLPRQYVQSAYHGQVPADRRGMGLFRLAEPSSAHGPGCRPGKVSRVSQYLPG